MKKDLKSQPDSHAGAMGQSDGVAAGPREEANQEAAILAAGADEAAIQEAAILAVSPHEEAIQAALRRIIRAVDLHSRALASEWQLTGPQLVCLHQLLRSGPSTPGDLARAVATSQATLTGVLDRLAARGLVQRERDANDRRRVIVSLTGTGDALARTAPSALQTRFAAALARLPEAEQRAIAEALSKVAGMMEVPAVESNAEPEAALAVAAPATSTPSIRSRRRKGL